MRTDKCCSKFYQIYVFLARQSIAIRGDGDEENSNFIQLFKLRGEDDPKFAKWLEKKTDKYVSADIQNELLKVMGLQVEMLRQNFTRL